MFWVDVVGDGTLVVLGQLNRGRDDQCLVTDTVDDRLFCQV